MLALSVTSQVRLAKKVVAAMIARRQGRILITSSLSATTPTPYQSIYGRTRAFMCSFAEGLREELREYGVTVAVLLLGATATEFHEWAGMGDTIRLQRLEEGPSARRPQRRRRLVRRQGPRYRRRPQDRLPA